MTTSLAAVFIPILFMAGILGRLFREFAVTITTAVIISGIVSVTLTPMLCSRFLQIRHTKKGLAGLMDRGFDALQRGYARTLRLALDHRLAMLAVFGLVVVATVRMFGIVPKGFIPDSDNDALFVNMRAAQGTSYYEMVGTTEKVAEQLNRNPYIEAMMVNTGGGSAGGMNQGRLNIQLTPRANRPVTAAQIAQQLRQVINRFPQFRGSVNVPQALQIGGFRGDSSYNLMVESLDSDALYTWVPRLMDAVGQLPEVLDVSTNLESRSPRLDLQIDRDKAEHGEHRQPVIERQTERARVATLQRVDHRERTRQRPRPALGDDHLRPARAVSRAAGARPALPAAGRHAAEDLLQDAVGRHGAARVGGPLQGHRRSTVGQSHRAAPGSVDLVQRQAGCIARRRCRSRHAGGQGHAAADGHDDVPGIGEGVPAVDVEPDAAAHHRHRRRLHRAGNAV
jgi:hypothetical protein